MGIKDTIMAWAANKNTADGFTPDAEISAQADEQERLRVAAEDHKILADVAAEQNNPISTEDYKRLLADGGFGGIQNDTITVQGRATNELTPVPVSDNNNNTGYGYGVQASPSADHPMTVSFHDGDTLYADSLKGTNGYNPKGYRAEEFNAPESTFATGQAARAAALAATKRVEVDTGSTGGHGRGQYVGYDKLGRPVSSDLAELGLAFPMAEFNSPQSVDDSLLAGDMREAMGLPRSLNSDMNQLAPYLKQYEDNHQIDMRGFESQVAAPEFRHHAGVTGTFRDSLARGKDQLDSSLGGAVEYAGEQLGVDSWKDSGKQIREDNDLQASYNTPKVGSIEDIHSLSDAGTYALERTAEAIPGAAVDAAAMTLTGGGSLGWSAARRGLADVVTGALKKQTIKAAGRGAMASGFVQGVGSEQIRMKNAGIEDTGMGPLENGVATALLNKVTDTLPLHTFLESAGIDEVTKRSVQQIARDGAVAGAKAVAHGFAVGGGVGYVQNAIEQSIHIGNDDNMSVDDFRIGEDINAAMASALGAASMNLGAKADGKLSGMAARYMNEYYQALRDTDLAAAERDMVDERVRQQNNAHTSPDFADIYGKVTGEAHKVDESVPSSRNAETLDTLQRMIDAEDNPQAKGSMLEQIRAAMEPAGENPTHVEGTTRVEGTTPVEESPQAATQTPPPEHRSAGFGTLHSLDPVEVPQLHPERYHEVEKLLTDEKGDLVSLQKAQQAVKDGHLTPEEVVQFLADDFNPRADVVYSRHSAEMMQTHMADLVEKVAGERTRQYQLERAAGRATPNTPEDQKARTAIDRARFALQGRFYKENMPEGTLWKDRFVKTEFADEKSKIRATNDVLKSALRDLGYGAEVDAMYGAASADYHVKKTFQEARNRREMEIVAAPKEEAPVEEHKFEVDNKAEPASILDPEGLAYALQHYTATDKDITPVLDKTIDLIDKKELQKRYVDVVNRAKEDKEFAAHIAPDLIKLMSQKGDPEAVTAGQRELLKKVYRNMVNEYEIGTETSKQEMDNSYHDPEEDDGTEPTDDTHDTTDDVGQSYTDDPESVAPSYQRRTAYASSVLDQIAERTGADMSGVKNLYNNTLLDHEVNHKGLTAGESSEANVRLTTRDVEEQVDANSPLTRAKGVSTKPDVRTVTRRTLNDVKKAVENGEHAKALAILQRKGLLPEKVDANGHSVDTRSLFQKALVPEVLQSHTKADLLHGVMVDSEGRSVSAAVDVQRVTEGGAKELGYMNEHGEWLVPHDMSFPKVLNESFHAGLATIMEPKNGFAFQVSKIDSHQPIWRDRGMKTSHVTYGDSLNHTFKHDVKATRAELQRSHNIDDLADEHHSISKSIRQLERAGKLSSERSKELHEHLSLLEERMAELRDRNEPFDSDANIAGLRSRDIEVSASQRKAQLLNALKADREDMQRRRDAEVNPQQRSALDKQLAGLDKHIEEVKARPLSEDGSNTWDHYRDPEEDTVHSMFQDRDGLTDNDWVSALDKVDEHSQDTEAGNFADHDKFQAERGDVPYDPTQTVVKDYKTRAEQRAVKHEPVERSKDVPPAKRLKAVRQSLAALEKLKRSLTPVSGKKVGRSKLIELKSAVERAKAALDKHNAKEVVYSEGQVNKYNNEFGQKPRVLERSPEAAAQAKRKGDLLKLHHARAVREYNKARNNRAHHEAVEQGHTKQAVEAKMAELVAQKKAIEQEMVDAVAAKAERGETQRPDQRGNRLDKPAESPFSVEVAKAHAELETARKVVADKEAALNTQPVHENPVDVASLDEKVQVSERRLNQLESALRAAERSDLNLAGNSKTKHRVELAEKVLERRRKTLQSADTPEAKAKAQKAVDVSRQVLADANKAHADTIKGLTAKREALEQARAQAKVAVEQAKRARAKADETPKNKLVDPSKAAQDLADAKARLAQAERRVSELRDVAAEPKPVREQVADDRRAEVEAVQEAPVEVQRAVKSFFDQVDENRSAPGVAKSIRLLTERAQQSRGDAKHRGFAKFLNGFHKVFTKIVYHGVAEISPWSEERARHFGTDSIIRAQEFAARLREFDGDAKVAQAAYDDLLNGVDSDGAKSLRTALNGILERVREIDPTYDWGDVPTVFDIGEMQRRMADLKEILQREGVEDLEGFVNNIQTQHGLAGPRYFDIRDTPSKIIGTHRDTELVKRLAPVLRREGFLKTDAPEILAAVAMSAGKYMEWGRQFGLNIKDATGAPSHFDPSFKYRTIMDTLTPSDAAQMRKMFATLTGTIGYNVPNWVRTLNSVAFAWTASHYLLFSGVASIPELAIVGARTRKGLQGQVAELSSNLMRVALTDRKALVGMAESLGILHNQVVHHSLLNRYNMGELTTTKAASWMADKVFKINQQYAITNLTATTAMVSGMNFIAEHGRLAQEGNAKSAQYLKELRISPEDAVRGQTDNNQNYQDAVRRFVHESLANPEPGVMPRWMSDPRYAVVASLKKFVYGLFNRVHVGVYEEGRQNGIGQAAAITVGYATVAMALGALSESLRALIKNPTMADKPNQHMDGWDDKFWRVFNATGLQGHAQLFAGPRVAYDVDKTKAGPFLAALNPTLDWIYSDLIFDDKKTAATKTAEAVPVASQLPWAKSWLAGQFGGKD